MRTIKTLDSTHLFVGDFILFQLYDNDSGLKQYQVSKPFYGIFMGYDVWDQALVMKYVLVPKQFNQDNEIELLSHAEWMDYCDILGFWRGRPAFRELLAAYRNRNQEKIMSWNDVKIDE